MNVNMPRNAAAGRTAGRHTCQYTRIIEQPSTLAASINSYGTTCAVYCRIQNTPIAVTRFGTIAAGFVFARLVGLTAPYGALAGVGTAVCGASATLATSAVLPDYAGKDTDVVFVVVAVNALATLAIVTYPPLCAALGFGDQLTGVMLGATIHDVAQVVGAGYAVSDTAGNAAVIVKLFRVFLLLPVVLATGWWFARKGAAASAARVPVPVFAFVFLALCMVNSVLPSLDAVAPLYAGAKTVLVMASTGGLLIAIAALGLGTSIAAIGTLGWRHIATVGATTLVILVVVTAGLALMR